MASNIPIEWLDFRNPDQKAVQGSLSSWITKFLPQYQPGEKYTGKLSAGMSDYESQGLGYLGNYLSQSGVTPALNNAQGYLSKVLGGGFNPQTSDYYKALKEEAMTNNQEALDETKRGNASRNKYFSSEALRSEGDVRTKTANYLNKVLGELGQFERGQQTSALPYVTGINEAVTQEPYKKALAATTIGALPRALEQSDLERQYQEFIRQKTQMAAIPNIATSFPSNLTMQPWFQTPQPSGGGGGGGWWDSWGKDAAGLALTAMAL